MSKPVSFYTVGQMIEELSKVDPSTPILIREFHFDYIKEMKSLFEVRLVKEDGSGDYTTCSLFDDKSFKAVVIDDHGW